MTEVVRKKMNLLIHLAQIDGQFDESEKKVLESLLTEAGIATNIPTESTTYKSVERRAAAEAAKIFRRVG
jgi:hypothetical protein